MSSPSRLLAALLVPTWMLLRIPALDAADEPPLRKVQITINAWEGYVEPCAAGFIAAMRERHHLEVEFVRTSATGLDSFRSHLRDHSADLVSPANDLLRTLKDEGLIRPLDPALVPNLAQVNPIILDNGYFRIDGRTWGAPFTYGPYALAYNRAKLAKPTSYEVLWDERWKGRVSVSNYDTANIYMVALALHIPASDLFKLSDGQLARIEAKMRELHAQVGHYWADNLEPECAKTIDLGTDWGIGVHLINSKGGDWAMTVPNEGATAWVDNWAISSAIDPAKLPLVHEFIDYQISARVEAEVARHTSYGPANIYATRYLTVAEKLEYHITDADYLGRLILWQPLDAATLARYQAAWKRATR